MGLARWRGPRDASERRMKPTRLGALLPTSALLSALLCAAPVRAQISTVEALEKQASAKRQDPEFSLAYGRALRRAGRTTEAGRVVRRAANATRRGNPKLSVALHHELARIAIARRDFPRALSACRVTGMLREGELEGHLCEAEAHLLWRRGTRALDSIAKAKKLDPKSYDAHVLEGRAHGLALADAAAEKVLRAAIQIDPMRSEAHRALGDVLWHAGKKDEAIAAYRHAAERDPGDAEALYALGQALVPKAGLPFLERATREREQFGDGLIALAQAELDLGMIARAKETSRKAIQAAPLEVEPHVIAGKVALREKRPDDALAHAKHALDRQANDADAKLLLADAQADKGEIDHAIASYEAAFGLDRSDVAALLRGSRACLKAGRKTSAVAFARRATASFPKNAGAWAALGDALGATGEADEAKLAYKRAVELGAGKPPGKKPDKSGAK